MRVMRHTCSEDHFPHESVSPERAIGKRVGYVIFGNFIEGGGYEVDPSVIDQIETWNTTYQETEYDPRQEEANEIHDWLETAHEVDEEDCTYCEYTHHNMLDFQTERDNKIARLFELDAEITSIYNGIADDIRALIDNDYYCAFLADQE